MSFAMFAALCILGLDLMIYVLFRLVYGDKRAKVARELTDRKKRAKSRTEASATAGGTLRIRRCSCGSVLHSA
jgi:hypothetical protein